MPSRDEIEEAESFIKKINKMIVSKTKEPSGLNYDANLYFIVYEALRKKESRGDSKDFCIVLMQRIAERHPFKEGNKRTAFVVGKAFLLRMSKCLFLCTDDKGIRYMRHIADMSEPKIYKDVKRWILLNSDEISDLPNRITKSYLNKLPKEKRRKIVKYIRTLTKLNIEVIEG